MIFYLGGEPSMLWGSSQRPAAGVPLFVSRRRLKDLNRLRKARAPWALDSGGFMELALHGEWRLSARDYAREVRRYAAEIGNLQWAAAMDWMCEPPVIYGGPVGQPKPAPGTGLSLEEHQLRTVENYCKLREIGGRDMAHLWAPVLQGWCVEDYVEHVHLYAMAHIDLREAPVVGVGSVCRRQHTEMASALFTLLDRLFGLGGHLHAFGAKKTGLPLPAGVEPSMEVYPEDYQEWAERLWESGWTPSQIQQAVFYATDSAPSTWEDAGASVCELLQSSDSMAWSYGARERAKAILRLREEAFGGKTIQDGPYVILQSSGRRVGKVQLELFGKIDVLAPTQMLRQCAVGAIKKTPGRSHQSCSSCVWYALKWRKELMSALPPLCRSVVPEQDPRISGAPICAAGERVATRRAQLRSYELDLLAGGEIDPARARMIKHMPGAEGPLLPVQALQAVYPRIRRRRSSPAPADFTCRAWGTGDFRWGEVRAGEDVPAIPSPWQPEVMRVTREARRGSGRPADEGVVNQITFRRQPELPIRPGQVMVRQPAIPFPKRKS